MARKSLSDFGQGFTLMELIIVISIIMVLTTVGLGSFMTAQKKARDAQRKNDLSQVGRALELFINDWGYYPNSSSGSIVGCGVSASVVCAWGSSFSPQMNGATQVYAKALPLDPQSVNNYFYVKTASGEFSLYSILENKNDPACRDDLTTSCGTSLCNYWLSESGVKMPTGSESCSVN